jgi:poly(A) polymerase
MAQGDETARKLDAVKAVLLRLREAGHEAWLNGGCVRDHLLGKEPADFDVATSATPGQVEGIFPRSIAVGKAFGVVRVPSRGCWFEVATFRRDGRYLDGRHPETVSFSTAPEDAARRDFTINGMFWDPLTGEIRDYVGGRRDLEHRIVRAIGDADARLSEDALRILRAVRFGAMEGFHLDPATRDAVIRHRDLLRGVAVERVREELFKIASGAPEVRRRGVLLLAECRVLDLLLPEARGIDAGRAAAVAARCPGGGLPSFTASILGRALPEETRPPAWEALARSASARLRFTNDEAATLKDLLSLRVRARGGHHAPTARRRLLATVPRYPHLRELLLAEGGDDEAVAALERERAALGGVRPPPLLDGHELLALGVPPRRPVGAMLRRVWILGLSGRAASRADAEQNVRRRVAAGPR